MMYEDCCDESTFVITDDNVADWAVKKIKEDLSERDRLLKIIDTQLLELQDKAKSLEDEYQRKTQFLTDKLNEYFETVNHKETKTQETYKLVSGSLVRKKASKKMVRPDDDTLIQFMNSNGYEDFIDTVYKPAWGDFKKHFEIKDDVVIEKESGEIIDMIKLEDVPESFGVK